MHPLLFLAISLLAINIWATRRVWRFRSPYSMPKGMLVAMIWIAPFAGAWIAVLQTPVARPNASASTMPDLSAIEPAPWGLQAHDGSEWSLQPYLGLVQHVPLLDWKALADWAQGQGDHTAQVQAIEQGRRAWLLHLRQALWPQMAVRAAEQVLMLSSLDDVEAQALARYVAKARQRATQTLGELAQDGLTERTVILVLDTEEDYYHYVSIYYPEEGEFAFSGGMFIHAGCPHFVVVRADISSLEPVIAHELTHSALAWLALPKWLDEGLAVNTEQRVAGVRGSLYTPYELHRMHRAYWSPERIQAFWTGASFDDADKGNLLSYDLARIMVQQLGQDWPNFVRFVQAAERSDGGARAAQEVLNIRLGALAASLFEQTEHEGWEPVQIAEANVAS